MSSPTSTSAEVGGNASDSNEPTGQSEWFSAARGGPHRPGLFMAALLVVGLLAGGGAALVAVERRPPRATVTEEGPSPSSPQVTGPVDAAAGVDRPPRETASPAVPPPPIWRPSRDEVYPNAKRLASRVVESLTNFDAGTVAQLVADRTGRRFAVAPAELLGAARELVRPGAGSAGVVVYPQLAGVRPDSAGVMVVVDQTLDDGTNRWVERRTVDVRLTLRGQDWALERVESAGGAAIERPENLSESALRVVEHPAIILSDSARWDIYSGAVDDGLLRMMARAADRHEIAVVTVATGHPRNVFATDITSNHTLGRAVDIFSVDGQEVVGSREKGSPAFRLARWLYDQGVPELGSPWAFDGYGGRSFTDIVHADHIHFAI